MVRQVQGSGLVYYDNQRAFSQQSPGSVVQNVITLLLLLLLSHSTVLMFRWYKKNRHVRVCNEARFLFQSIYRTPSPHPLD